MLISVVNYSKTAVQKMEPEFLHLVTTQKAEKSISELRREERNFTLKEVISQID